MIIQFPKELISEQNIVVVLFPAALLVFNYEEI